MAVFIESSEEIYWKNRTKKTPTRTSEFSKVIGYKINTQKFVAFPYPSNEPVQSDIQNDA